MKNKILIGIVSAVLIFLFLFVAYGLTNQQQNQTFEGVNKIQPEDHLKWSKDKKNILVEYSDLQCPACKNFHEIIKSEIEASGSGNTDIIKKITFVYRHFPLYGTHKNAEAAAFAAEAAGMQGKFFEMVDLQFEEQNNWKDSSKPQEYFIGLAKKLDLDLEKFENDVKSEKIKDKVDQDVLSGNQGSVNATPTFFLNGKKLDSVRSFEEFIQLLKETK